MIKSKLDNILHWLYLEAGEQNLWNLILNIAKNIQYGIGLLWDMDNFLKSAPVYSSKIIYSLSRSQILPVMEADK